ncbi:MAG TPA: cytochrome c oxidase assembly protein [Rhizomicrobium sp.]|jgi:cytochrome c oxidase assembly factor CtaG|nr:cytochrome c oxidase assembly protein [Rhizomicrobium sp.]
MPQLVRPGLLQKSAVVAGLATIAAVLLPPLSRLGETLFAAHMAQHLLLIAVAAPLLVAGGISLRVRPLWAWILFVGIFLFWHWPAAFQWAARDPITQLLELLSILFAAFLFWSTALVDSTLSYGGRALLVMTAAVATDLPGVVMLFAPTPFAVMPHENAAAFGLTPLSDQQIAGLLMWVPANLVFFGIATFLFARWMAAPHLSSTPLVSP